MAKIILHLCGGTGISLSKSAFESVASLGDGFSDVEFNYLDASTRSIDKIPAEERRGKFWQVTKLKLTDAEIQGGGGERRAIFQDIRNFIPKYIDEKGYHKRITGEYHMVVFSGSGASGSVIGPLLIDNLLATGIPVIAVVVGDSGNAMYAKNTLNTLSSINNMAMNRKKPLSVIYANNHSFGQGSGNAGEKHVNERIRNIVSVLSLFLSGNNLEIDQKDMEGFVDQSMYTTITVPAGLYGLSVFSNDIDIPEGSIPTMARTLTLQGEEAKLNIELMHHKVGYIVNENAKAIFESQVPLHLVTYSNFFVRESEALQAADKRYKEMEESIKNQNITGTHNSNVQDDGFVL